MQNILEVHPAHAEKPTEPVRRLAERLLEVAVSETQARKSFSASPGNFRNKYYSHLDLAPKPVHLETFKENIMLIARRVDGIKGPVDNARMELDYWAKRAYSAGYPTESPTLQRAFYDFLIVAVTAGFEGKDTTGTQIGNHSDEGLGGMGFSKGGLKVFGGK